MNDYKKLIADLRRVDSWQGNETLCGKAADAIEQLLESSLNFEELWQQSMEMRRELQAKLDTQQIKALLHYKGNVLENDDD